MPEINQTHRTFTSTSLPEAITSLLQMNNYEVRANVHVHGAEVDLIATAKGDPFANPIYIEATVEYINNAKYGKDSTKFLLIKTKVPHARLLCISSSGFTPDVGERARESGVEILTYDDLFRLFEKFSPYAEHVLKDKSLLKLNEAYEEPQFNDPKGVDGATEWLSRWKAYKGKDAARWLIILGEYGTGKTALSNILQYRWLNAYFQNPHNPIPIRIELRSFNRQFDARGLLHHFLDQNHLSHISINFMLHLIRTGRAILLLDGYDEMAQFLNARERRACLSALAELASDGAKGIITSRPNYFSESEELNVFEALYASIDQNKFYLSGQDRRLLEEEKAVDSLVERYVLDRYERSLQDLTPDQTRSLVRRKLKSDKKGQDIVLGLLEKVFREEAEGSRQALSGKPVIISYLLELVDELRNSEASGEIGLLTEWQVYKLIVDRLMFRDLQRTPMNPTFRRIALQRLAIALSQKDYPIAQESLFFDVINKVFAVELKRLPNDERTTRRNELFEDLRSSATLTRTASGKGEGWFFSHNSLREFLVAEFLIDRIFARDVIEVNVPISDAMRGFVASMSAQDLEKAWNVLSELWPQRLNQVQLGPYLSLLWEAGNRDPRGIFMTLRSLQPSNEKVEFIFLNQIALKGVALDERAFAKARLDFSGSGISDSSITGCNISGSNFESAILDNVSLEGSDLSLCDFRRSFLFDCNLIDCNLLGSNFLDTDEDIVILVKATTGISVSITGPDAIGYLNFNGARTNVVPNFFIYKHHSRFPIVKKILENISEQRNSQLRGLTQRGEARIDPPFARSFVDKLESLGWVEFGRKELVSVTAGGRDHVQRMVLEAHMPDEIAEFLRSYAP